MYLYLYILFSKYNIYLDSDNFRALIKYHSIVWRYKLHNSVQIIIGKDGVLVPCELSIKVKQVYFYRDY